MEPIEIGDQVIGIHGMITGMVAEVENIDVNRVGEVGNDVLTLRVICPSTFGHWSVNQIAHVYRFTVKRYMP